VSWLENPHTYHRPQIRKQVLAPRGGFITAVQCETIGWAVQRLGAGREKAGEPVAPMAGIEVHWKLGDKVEAGSVLYTMFADEAARFAEPERLLLSSTTIEGSPTTANPLVVEVIQQ
jgi:pyrimidine-nucleoside phosphorylase